MRESYSWIAVKAAAGRRTRWFKARLGAGREGDGYTGRPCVVASTRDSSIVHRTVRSGDAWFLMGDVPEIDGEFVLCRKVDKRGVKCVEEVRVMKP